jgi:hypothetical protein
MADVPSDVGDWTNNVNANEGHGVGKGSGFRGARPVLRELPADSAQGLLMPLSLRERLTMLMPPSVFYRQRIAQEARTGEPELAVLAELVPRGGIAVDVGANVGFFAYALADIADRVVAFEPNPDYAFFARWMLRGRAEVREVALCDASGRGTFIRPAFGPGGAAPPRRQPEAKSRPVSQYQDL